MVKIKTIKELVCDGCKKPMEDASAVVVTFQTHDGLFRYDMCEKCAKEFRDILERPEKEEKKRIGFSLADFSIENREKLIASNQNAPTKVVDSLGTDRIDRDLKLLQKMHANGYSTEKMAKLSGLSQTNIARLSRGVGAPRASTLDILERMFVKEGFLRLQG